ncbi:MAG TPA: biotin--[acetyl-CoA-carboxylase] ligase, partial [Turneriella sp.]|nr:biotin--[acetyl-CoA-carboxylase] ligase [Turneriella sp.]
MTKNSNKNRFVVIDHTPSTNTWIKEHPEFHRPYFSLRAREQTQGRGQYSRSWFSGGRDENLAFSIVLPIQRADLSCAPLILALVLHYFLSQYIETKIKWPNDILCHGKKIAGILCETIPHNHSLILAGIGVNVNTKKFPTELTNTTSLALEGATPPLEQLWRQCYRSIVRAWHKANFPLSVTLIRDYNDAAYTYVKRPEISSSPLTFQTLLPNGSALFQS